MPIFDELTNTAGLIWNIPDEHIKAITDKVNLPGIETNITADVRRDAFTSVYRWAKDCMRNDGYADCDISLPDHNAGLRKYGDNNIAYFWSHTGHNRPLNQRVKSMLENSGVKFSADRNNELADIIKRKLPLNKGGNWRAMLTTLDPSESAREHVNVNSCLFSMYESYRFTMMECGVKSLRLINPNGVITHRAWVLEGEAGYIIYDFYHVNGKIENANYRLGLLDFSMVLAHLDDANGALLVNVDTGGKFYKDTDDVIFVPKMGAKMGLSLYPTFDTLAQLGLDD